VLRELDFSVKGLMARVLWSDPGAIDRPATHMLLAVEISGTTYIADVGFGGLTLTAPLKLRADSEQATPHETFRLTGGAPLWQLEARIGEAWKPLYAFDTTEKAASDYAAANDAIAADPASPFRRELCVALAPEGRRLALRNNRLTIHVGGQPAESRMLTSLAEMHDVLTDMFDIHLPAPELLDPRLEAILADAVGTEA
jgi:N-hydroxyarylamine O-acetyltransferase